MLHRDGYRDHRDAAGSQRGLQVVVDDVESARRELLGRGVPASDVVVQPWGSFVTFDPPDGNTMVAAATSLAGIARPRQPLTASRGLHAHLRGWLQRKDPTRRPACSIAFGKGLIDTPSPTRTAPPEHDSNS